MAETKVESISIQREHHSKWKPERQTVLRERGEIMRLRNYEKSQQHKRYVNVLEGLKDDTKPNQSIQSI